MRTQKNYLDPNQASMVDISALLICTIQAFLDKLYRILKVTVSLTTDIAIFRVNVYLWFKEALCRAYGRW